MLGERAADGGTELLPSIASLSATELGVLLPEIADINAVGRVVQRIVSAIADPVIVDGTESFTSCAIGISVAPVDGEDFDSLMQRAEQAQRVARAGRNGERYAFYQRSMTETLVHAMRIESGLRRALERNEFQIVYQPQVNIAGSEVCGFEALLRWTHGDGGVVSPSEFIPVAETSGLIGPIGDWVLRSACWQARELAAGQRHCPPRCRERLGGADHVGRLCGAGDRDPEVDAGGSAADRTGDHRNGVHERPARRPRRPCASCANWACTSPWMISAPAIPR